MRYCKGIEEEHITYIGTGDTVGIDIAEDEYNEILAKIKNKPEDTPTHYYALRADTLEYEPIERAEPLPVPEKKYTIDEAAELIAQEVASE
ncbi:MAG: hypothetical protein MR440_03685 [Firmicutes bacterium]|nr:hypothetical protein [Bacillota bacterium]